MKRGCLILLIGLLAVLCIVVAVASFLVLQTPAAQPLVQITAPHNGDRVAVGQETVIQAVARGDASQKIKRVELWVDGQLKDAQSSTVTGGTSPFPIVTNWQPPTPGAHSVIVRAFNTQGKQGQASINVEAVASGDRDNDNVPDALDGCPDQPGLTTNNGCPAPATGDRDGDGVPDSSDACADQPGTLLAGGCPDADGDGVRDSTDACPREPGTAERNGCPAPGDADSDGVPDASDACPRDPGRAEAGGCPDRDADGVRDGDDACPDAAGSGSTRGCPDADGDGVYDTIDLCPTVPGPASNAGCPPTGTGDRDGDGVDDGTDLRPTEPGSADSGGAPPPRGGADGDGDGSVDAEEPPEDPTAGFDFSGLFFRAYVFTTVEVQALEFQTTHDYNRVYCYASLAGSAEERIGPFSALGARRWDIAAIMGPLNSRTLFVAQGAPLQVRVECSGIVTLSREAPVPGSGIGEGGMSEAYFDLGSFTRSHNISGSNIDEVTVDSSGGTAGHSFRVKYRVCTPGCKTPVLRAPNIRLTHPYGMHFLWWDWAGQSYDINGFKVYMNGNYMFSVGPRETHYRFRDVPPCGSRFDIQLTAYRGNPHHPDQESPRSNVVTWEAATCPRTVTVRFDRFETGNLRDAFPEITLFDVGPVYGSLWAGDERRDFDSPLRFLPNHSHRIDLLTPHTDFSVDLGPDESLSLAARIRDRDPFEDDTLFDFESIIPPAQVTTREYRMTNRGNTVVIQLTVTPRP
ncbi:MAG: thrombospondin type 3 repeat-containing protein [Chloroflexota bacterium]